MATTGRNDLCPCGSAKKYKKCCLDKDSQVARVAGSEDKFPPGSRIVELNGERYVASRGLDDNQLASASEFFDRKRRGQGPAQQMADFTQPLLDGAKDADSAQKAMPSG